MPNPPGYYKCICNIMGVITASETKRSLCILNISIPTKLLLSHSKVSKSGYFCVSQASMFLPTLNVIVLTSPFVSSQCARYRSDFPKVTKKCPDIRSDKTQTSVRPKENLSDWNRWNKYKVKTSFYLFCPRRNLVY